jgi:hypothetical protein
MLNVFIDGDFVDIIYILLRNGSDYFWIISKRILICFLGFFLKLYNSNLSLKSYRVDGACAFILEEIFYIYIEDISYYNKKGKN